MKKFVIMRGLPGCGKSTFIKENHLENYTVSSDSIRLLVASTNMGIDGSIGISQREDKWVWEKIYEILEIRFSQPKFLHLLQILFLFWNDLKIPCNHHKNEILD